MRVRLVTASKGGPAQDFFTVFGRNFSGVNHAQGRVLGGYVVGGKIFGGVIDGHILPGQRGVRRFYRHSSRGGNLCFGLVQRNIFPRHYAVFFVFCFLRNNHISF